MSQPKKTFKDVFNNFDKPTLGIGALFLAAGSVFTFNYTQETDGIAAADKCFVQKKECTAQEYIQGHDADTLKGKMIISLVAGGGLIGMSRKQKNNPSA